MMAEPWKCKGMNPPAKELSTSEINKRIYAMKVSYVKGANYQKKRKTI